MRKRCCGDVLLGVVDGSISRHSQQHRLQKIMVEFLAGERKKGFEVSFFVHKMILVMSHDGCGSEGGACSRREGKWYVPKLYNDLI